jgi:hypothetical protein
MLSSGLLLTVSVTLTTTGLGPPTMVIWPVYVFGERPAGLTVTDNEAGVLPLTGFTLNQPTTAPVSMETLNGISLAVLESVMLCAAGTAPLV